MNNLYELAKQCPDVTISAKAGELIEMAQFCIDATRAALEQQLTDAAAETYPSRQKVAEILDVDLSTLHRWAKQNYLVPIEIGGKRRYRMSDIKQILQQKGGNNGN